MNLTEGEYKRRLEVAAHGGAGDYAFMKTLGSQEQHDWHEARKLVDPEHLNPYNSRDRQKAVSTPNTPTPELEPAAWENEFGELSHHKPSINPSPLYDVAAIAKLTAERDALRDAGLDEQMNNIHLCRDLAAAEKRAKELETERDALKDENVLLVAHEESAVYRAEAMLQELKAATGHDDGLVAIRHLILRATQAEDYITEREAE